MQLLPGETVVSAVDLTNLTLTTHRVRYENRTAESNKVIGITLDAVSSCGLVSKSKPLLLAGAGLLGAYALSLLTERGGYAAFEMIIFFAALALLVWYLATRTTTLMICSPGESIQVPAQGLNPDTMTDVIDAIEEAKLNYLAGVTGYGEPNTARSSTGTA